MKKEIGKWLMDIAKYVATAIFLTSILGDMSEKWQLYAVASGTIVICLVTGLLLIRERE
jgi:low affinity Fe/Cu permease